MSKALQKYNRNVRRETTQKTEDVLKALTAMSQSLQELKDIVHIKEGISHG